MRCGFWQLFQWHVCPCSSQSFSNESTAGVSWFVDIYRCLFIRSQFAVGRHHRRRTPWCPHGRQLRRVKVFLTDHMHTRPGINYKLSLYLLWLSWWGIGRNHIASEKNVALSFSLSLKNLLASSQALLWAHRSCLSVSSWDRSANFCSMETSLMSRFDFYLSKRWSFFLSPIPAWRSVDSVNRTLWIAFKTFCIGFLRNSVVPWEARACESCNTQPTCGTLFKIATAPLSSLPLLFRK